jgi:FlaA1/EpsC-like NDP-sugar epimerase
LISALVNRLRILPRWIILLIDGSILFFSVFIGYLVRFNLNWEDIQRYNLLEGSALYVVCGLLAVLLTKSYAGIVRYTGVEDGIRILYTVFLALIFSGLTNLIYYYNSGSNLIPYSVIIIAFFTSFLFLFYYRLVVKTIFTYYKNEKSKKIDIAIFGAGSAGLLVKQIIDANPVSDMRVVAFLEDDTRKVGKEIQGARIYHSTDQFARFVKELRIHELIISTQNLSLDRKNEIVENCFQNHVKVRTVPPVDKWVRGELSLKQIKEINIEDLLGRESIVLDNDQLFPELTGKRVVITGAAGSIGSEIARQVAIYRPLQLVLIDQAESPLFEIERELSSETSLQGKLQVFVADICNHARMQNLFMEFKPEIIFHAAAYKHVPMMESNPSEAVMTNILGTRILADLAVKTGVSKFVMISTDKAVNPTSVMGCSKRIAEIYVQTLNNSHQLNSQYSTTAFVTTRFGNVLGSNGSVIPVFKKQIASGGPVTVTHPDITRYFMTIPEACRLVLEAGVMGQGGEIFLFDMGKPVRIYDLAKKMIFLSGLELKKDIDIVFTGLREGEKLFEELLNDRENTIPTHHNMILKAKTRAYDFDQISNLIDLFEDLIADKNELKMVALMKEIVPEFKSNYSRYKILDDSI